MAAVFIAQIVWVPLFSLLYPIVGDWFKSFTWYTGDPDYLTPPFRIDFADIPDSWSQLAVGGLLIVACNALIASVLSLRTIWSQILAVSAVSVLAYPISAYILAQYGLTRITANNGNLTLGFHLVTITAFFFSLRVMLKLDSRYWHLWPKANQGRRRKHTPGGEGTGTARESESSKT